MARGSVVSRLDEGSCDLNPPYRSAMAACLPVQSYAQNQLQHVLLKKSASDNPCAENSSLCDREDSFYFESFVYFKSDDYMFKEVDDPSLFSRLRRMKASEI